MGPRAKTDASLGSLECIDIKDCPADDGGQTTGGISYKHIQLQKKDPHIVCLIIDFMTIPLARKSCLKPKNIDSLQRGNYHSGCSFWRAANAGQLAPKV